MASTAFPLLAKKVQLSDGTTYGYVAVPPSTPDQVSFLLLHGYPSSSYDWRHQITGLQKAGYGVIAPDLLGYGDTDKPTDINAYRKKAMCEHLIEILDQEGVSKIVVVGHDWGVVLASRLVTYYRDRCHGLVTVAVSYSPPGNLFDIDAICEITKKMIGYETFGYWKWHNTDEAAKDCNDHPASVFTLLYPDNPSLWKSDFAPEGKAAEFVRSGRITPLPSWYPLDEYTIRDRIFAKGGYAGPLSWYKSAMRGADVEDEVAIPEADKPCAVPSLFVAAKQDYVCRVDLQSGTLKQGAPDGRIEEIDAGHWVQLEQPAALNRLLISFADEVKGAK
ncbi:putative epoxide hydrolase [Aspergillus bertholletiae]|uniref:Putative epoxide hydrolase n=1 Tax=Aspergillus bertholletiae TaxID=1226010 RepID=A0A5N7BNU1_9EURO|nr:putative epoxide hydrolase [Aspergillus bertholletiae]